MTHEDAEILLACAEIMEAVSDGHRCREIKGHQEPGDEQAAALLQCVIDLHAIASGIERALKASENP